MAVHRAWRVPPYRRFVAVIAGLAMASLLAPVRAADREEEVRGLWVRRASLSSPDAIRKMVSSAATAGFNAVFVQAGPEAGSGVRAAFDATAETIRQAHAAGLRVHAWVDVLVAASASELPSARDHVVYRHPDWLMVPREIAADLLAVDSRSPNYVGRLARWTRANAERVGGLYISPVQPEAAAQVAETVRDLARQYAFDGVYLDHVQYPGDDFDYSRGSVAVFRDLVRKQLSLADRQRVDAEEAVDPFGYPNAFPDQWRLFRRSQLTSLVARLYSTVKAVRPTALVSAAVTADPSAAERDRLQDWRTWLDNGFLDALCPVATGVDATLLASQVGQVRAVSGTRPVWAGVGANRLAQRETVDVILAARRAGASGVILFSYDSLTSPARGPDYLSAIGRGAFEGS